MKLASLSAALFVVAGCVDGSPPVGDPNDVDTEGGTITLEQCGYDVTTRFGASAPVLGSARFGPDPTPRHVHLGLAGDATTSVVVQWRTNDDETLATTVQYGTGGNLDQTQEGLTFAFISGFNQSGEVVRMHETHLCGLTPDTEYSYRVGGVAADGSESWSPTYSFRTAPPANTSQEVVIANLGDSRDGYDILAKFIDLAAAESPDLILFSGDAVTVGAVQLEWDIFFEVGEELFASAPLIGAHGNHDVNAINYYSQWAMPGDEENFGFDYGPVHVTVLNDTPLIQNDIEGAAAEMLDADMGANADRPWKILMHHRPIWSASTRHGSDELLLEAWGPLIDEHHVDLVLAGHDHDYERSKPMKGSAVQQTAATGTIYVVSGGAGAGLYNNGSDFWTETSAKEHSSIILRARPGMLEYQAVRDDGSMLDSFTIIKD
jgi:hypothetical protein